MLNRPRAILFDMGGTLLRQTRWEPRVGTARILELASETRGLTVDEIQEAVRALDADLVPRREESMLEIPPYAVRRLVYEPLGLRFSVSHEETERLFAATARSWEPEPDIRPTLTELAGREIPVAVVSNSAFSGRTLAWELEQHRLLEFFAFVMSSSDYVVRKPHPLLFRTAAAKLGVSPEEAWYVGDTVKYDITGAIAAGMGAIRYGSSDPDLLEPAPHAVIRHWPELIDLLDRTGG